MPVEPDHARIAVAITPATRAILPVHLYGQPADLDPILALARQHGLSVIKDADQDHGARYKGRHIGADGDAVCWNYSPGKNVSALGDGGVITTNRADLADRINVLRIYGRLVKHVNEVQGLISRLGPIHVAALRAKLPRLDTWMDRRRAIANIYSEGLRDSGLTLQHVPDWANPVWHLYVIRSSDRDGRQWRLAVALVGTLMHYPIPPHKQEAYADLGLAPDALPLARRLAREVLSLPIGPQLPLADATQMIDVSKGCGLSEPAYRTVLRSSSIIREAQVMNFAVGLVKMKLVAVLLGPAGAGLIGLYLSLIQTASSIAAMYATRVGPAPGRGPT